MRKIPFLFILSSLLLYLPTRRYGMVTDFVNWISRYDNGTTSDLWICFGYPGLHQFFHSVNYSIYSLFGTNEWVWYILTSALHGINAYLVYRLTEAILKHSQSEIKPIIPLLAGFIFLCMPYNVEAVVWKACLHYLITTGLILQSLRWLIQYFQFKNAKYLAYMMLAYLLALFSLELSFILPLLSLALLLFYTFSSNFNVSLKAGLQRIVFPQILLLALYLILNRWAIGNFIGHYGAEQHFNLSPELIFGNGLKYLSKYIIHPHFWPSSFKFIYYESLSSAYVYLPVVLVITGSLVYSLIRWPKLKSVTKSSILFFILFAIGLAPIITLFFSHTLLWENDRYGYLASAFFIPFFILAVANLPWKGIAQSMLLIWTAATLIFFGMMINNCYYAGKLQHALLDNFQVPDDVNTIYILSSPDNYRGMYLFRDYDTKGDFIRKSLKYIKGVKLDKSIHHVSQFNAVHVADKVNVRKLSSTKLVIDFGQYGNWFWKHGIGLSSYKTQDFTVSKNRYNIICEIVDPKPKDYILYSNGQNWQGHYLSDIEITDRLTGDAK